MSHRLAGAAVLAVLTLAGGCGTVPTPDPTPSATAVTDVQPTPTPTPAPDCPSGSYRVTGFTASSDGGTGQGGDLTATFDQGAFTLTGAGQDPVQVTVSGTKAEALINGTIRGTYTIDAASSNPTTGAYAVTGSEGSAKVSAGIIRRTVPMSEVVSLLTPDGNGTLSCTGDQVTLASPASRLDLQRS